MLEWLYLVQLLSATAAGLLLVILGLIGRVPSGFSVILLLITEVLLLVQLAVGLGVVIGGGRAVISTWEYFGYLLVALIVPIAGALWALIEKSRWSTLVMGLASLTVAVMLVRMWQIWSGESAV